MKTEELWRLRSEFLREIDQETGKEKIDTTVKVIISTALDNFIRWIEIKSGQVNE